MYTKIKTKAKHGQADIILRLQYYIINYVYRHIVSHGQKKIYIVFILQPLQPPPPSALNASLSLHLSLYLAVSLESNFKCFKSYTNLVNIIQL